jgi:ferritin-like metal-binding protein YciE
LDSRITRDGSDMTDGRLNKLLVAGMQDMLGADRQLLKAFPRLARAATDREVRTLCRGGVDYTEERIARLERSLRLLGVARPRAHRSPAMDGLIEEAMNAVHGSVAEDRDAVILGSVQKISHYGRAGYWTLCVYAEALHERKTKAILLKSLKEKEEAIRDMMKMAESDIVPGLARDDRLRADRAQREIPEKRSTGRSRAGRSRRRRAA